MDLYCHNLYQMVVVPNDCRKVFEVVLNKLVEAEWRIKTVTND